MKFKVKRRRSKPVPIQRFLRKARQDGLTTFLALGSFIGFLVIILNQILKLDLFGEFQWLSLVLGVGLVFESKIKRAFRTKTNITSKLLTLMIGISSILVSILTLPWFGLVNDLTVMNIILFVNILAAVVIFVELFFVD